MVLRWRLGLNAVVLVLQQLGMFDTCARNLRMPRSCQSVVCDQGANVIRSLIRATCLLQIIDGSAHESTDAMQFRPDVDDHFSYGTAVTASSGREERRCAMRRGEKR